VLSPEGDEYGATGETDDFAEEIRESAERV
jgi:hypothetical protein